MYINYKYSNVFTKQAFLIIQRDASGIVIRGLCDNEEETKSICTTMNCLMNGYTYSYFNIDLVELLEKYLEEL